MTAILFLAALIAPSMAQYNDYYSPCPSPSPSPSQCACDVEDFTTSYISFGSSTGNSKPIDNACHTYFALECDPCTFEAYFGITYCDGSTNVLTFLVTCNSTYDFIFVSPECSFVETYVGSVGDSDINVRKIISGDCPDVFFPALGASAYSDAGSQSDLPLVNQILNGAGYGCSNVRVLPRRYPYNCVTSQTSTNTGSSVNCPTGPDCGSDNNYNPPNNCPDNDYSPPSYSYSPPPSCGCSYYK